MKNWTGNKASVFTTNGATGHSLGEREKNDYYATDPIAIEMLLKVETLNKNIWECAVGGGHLAQVLKDNNYNLKISDIIDRGYPNTEIIDFLNTNITFNGDIVTNPPYKYAKEFVEKSHELINTGNKIIMFLKLTFLESQKRKTMFEKYPPKTIYVFSKRVTCAKKMGCLININQVLLHMLGLCGKKVLMVNHK